MALLRCISASIGAAMWMAGANAAGADLRQLSLAQRASAAEFTTHHGNPCDDEADGWQCDDDAVLECKGGRVASHQYCEFYQDCREGLGSASCEEDVCEDKADGFYCEDDHLVECQGLKTVNYTSCAFYQECMRDPMHPTTASCVEDVCDDQMDGMYCKEDHVVECRGHLTVDTKACDIGYDCHDQEFPSPTAACYDECHQRADGQHRKREGVLGCLDGQTVSFTACAFYQVSTEGEGTTATCQEDACDSKADGWHCRGDHMVQCSEFETIDVQHCPNLQSCTESEGSAPACV